jgi:poly(A) polymerase
MSWRVINELRRHGHKAYWVGGWVRDKQLRRPVKDRDVATSALPDEVAAIFPGARRLGERFGVVGVTLDDEVIQVATFRRDGGYSDGRRPDRVTYTTEEREDVERRDFTINGMLQDPDGGPPIDYVGGMNDLRLGLVRAIGDPYTRFREDRLRMLRAVRFAASLGFEIESGTMAAIRRCAAEIEKVAAERVREELGRILTEGGASRGFEMLARSGLLEPLLPEVAALKGVEQPPEFHPEGDVWKHTMIMLDGMEKPSEALGWGVLLHDVGKPSTFRRADRIRFHGHVQRGVEIARDICARLRFSNADTDFVAALVGNHMKFIDLQRMRPAKLRRFLEQPRFEDHLELHRLDCLASHGQLDNHAFASERSQRLAAEEPMTPLLTGHDLKAMGYVPGPIFGRILSAVEERQLNGELASRNEALEFVLELFPARSGGRERP